MPRTKQRKAKRSSLGYEQVVRDFNRLVQLKLHKLDLDFKGLEQKYDLSIQLALSRYPTEMQEMTLREILTPDLSPKKENLPPKTPRVRKDSKSSIRPPRSTNPKRVTTASDDGYQSESQGSHVSKATLQGAKRRSRSSSQDKGRPRLRSMSRDRQSKLSATARKKNTKDLLRTPSTRTMNTFVITPKVKLNSAVNVLRKPKDGEMVFSTQGSPLLVSTTVNDRTANINVPLRNGNIVSLLPFNDSSLTDTLTLDDETKHQLKILQSHLAKVLD